MWTSRTVVVLIASWWSSRSPGPSYPKLQRPRRKSPRSRMPKSRTPSLPRRQSPRRQSSSRRGRLARRHADWQLKPKTIVFADRPPENLTDPGTGFMRYEEWAKARPLEQQFLSLYPGYTEPNTDIVVDGVQETIQEKLHMYVAAARFVLSRQPQSIDLARLITLPFVEQIDPAIKQRLISASEVTSTQESKVILQSESETAWCEGRPTVICVRSHYQLEWRFSARRPTRQQDQGRRPSRSLPVSRFRERGHAAIPGRG